MTQVTERGEVIKEICESYLPLLYPQGEPLLGVGLGLVELLLSIFFLSR